MYNYRLNELAFDKIPADRYSYTVKSLDLKGQEMTNNFMKFSSRGCILELNLFFAGKNAKERFFSVIETIKDVTFTSLDKEYSCKLLNCDFNWSGDNALQAKINYRCFVFSRWHKIEAKSSLKALNIASIAKTPVILIGNATAHDVAINNIRFKVDSLIEEIVIDSLNCKLLNIRPIDPFELFYWQGLTKIKIVNLKNVTFAWRNAYVALA